MVFQIDSVLLRKETCNSKREIFQINDFLVLRHDTVANFFLLYFPSITDLSL